MTKKGDSFMKHSQIECCYCCEKRHERCHSTCEEYAKQKKDHEEYLDYIKKKVYIINICSILKNATFRENNTLLYERMVLFNGQQ